ncbi:MAG: hypothetical protein ACOC2W_01900 [bacterium]
MDNKKITYSFDSYNGHDNEDISSLINELNDCLQQKRRIEKEIKEIQDNCEHRYKFNSHVGHKNMFICCKCGHETLN